MWRDLGFGSGRSGTGSIDPGHKSKQTLLRYVKRRVGIDGHIRGAAGRTRVIPAGHGGATCEDDRVRPTTPLDRMAGAHDAAVLAVARRGDPVSRAASPRSSRSPRRRSRRSWAADGSGLVEEAGTVAAGPGKPTTLYQIVPGSRRAIGLHLTRLASATPWWSTSPGRSSSARARDRPPPARARAGRDSRRRGAGAAGRRPWDAPGRRRGMPGPVDGEEGVYCGTSAPTRWRGAPIRRLLAAELGMPVLLDHDSRAALVGEAWSQPGCCATPRCCWSRTAEAALCLTIRSCAAPLPRRRGRPPWCGSTGSPAPCGRRSAQTEYRAP